MAAAVKAATKQQRRWAWLTAFVAWRLAAANQTASKGMKNYIATRNDTFPNYMEKSGKKNRNNSLSKSFYLLL